MRSKTNIFLLLIFVVASVFTIWLAYQLNNVVGDLEENQDDQNFEVCNKRIFQYYQIRSGFKGGKKAIREEIINELATLHFENPGLLTYRFIINCKGEIGRFRARSTNPDLNNNQVNPENLQKIEAALLELKNWDPAYREPYFYDSYYVLNFKIRNGKIVDIF